MSQPPVLNIRQLSKRFGQRTAVDQVEFNIAAGEIFGLLGPNGAGKSTTVNLSVGLQKPDAGSVNILDKSPDQARAAGLIGLCPQDLAIYPELTAGENLIFFARLYGLRGKTLSTRIDELLELVNLSERRHDRADSFSGGMKRRLNLACALVQQPTLLLLDEPTVGIDPQSRNAILETVENLRDTGCAILYTTHYMEEAQRLCDRVGIIDHGRLLALDSVDALIKAHGGDTLVIATVSGEQRTSQCNDALAKLSEWQQQGELTEFRVITPTLEQVFLNLTGRELRE